MSLKMMFANKRFAPLFWTQFLGALNDNFLKNALVVMVTYKGVTIAGLDPEAIVALSGGLFILPFFLFSPIAGQLADKFEKARLVRATKWWELGIMVLAGVGLYWQLNVLLLAVLFLAGVQASLFGPLKYSILPDLVESEQLVAANAYVEMGTFIAILIGTIGGGILISLPGGEIWLTLGLVLMSAAGIIASYGVPKQRIACASLDLQWNPFPTIISTIGLLREKKAVFNSVLAISWFWFFGAAVLSLLPGFCKNHLGASEHVVTCFLAMFTIGIGVGSFICEKLSFRRVELGLVPIGSLGLTIFLLDIYWASQSFPAASGTPALTLSEFVNIGAGTRLLADFFMMSLFGGLFILPLYTLIQTRSHAESRSRVIAGNNIVNAAFMVASSLAVMGAHALHFSYAQIFMGLALMNLAVAFYVYSVVPEFTLRFYSWVLARALYRIKASGEKNIPEEGPAVLVCNHVSFVDWLVISGLCRRPVRYVMYYKFFEVPILKHIMKQAKVIPICGAKENPEMLKTAFDKISAELRDGEIVCIFPEGTITRTGEMNVFKPGIEKILERDPVPVIPMALKGLWGTFFSFGGGKALRKMPRHWFAPVELVIEPAIAAKSANAEILAKAVGDIAK